MLLRNVRAGFGAGRRAARQPPLRTTTRLLCAAGGRNNADTAASSASASASASASSVSAASKAPTASKASKAHEETAVKAVATSTPLFVLANPELLADPNSTGWWRLVALVWIGGGASVAYLYYRDYAEDKEKHKDSIGPRKPGGNY